MRLFIAESGSIGTKATQQAQEFFAALPHKILAPYTSTIWSDKQSDIKASKLAVEASIGYIDERIESIEKEGIGVTVTVVNGLNCNEGHPRKRPGAKGAFWLQTASNV